MRGVLGLLAGLFCCAVVSAQQNNERNIVCKKVAEYKSSEELKREEGWHYLTTDLYMLNAGGLTKTLRQMIDKRKIANIESLLITAQLKGNVFENIRYPLFNLNVSAQTSMQADNKEAIRIIDNLPLSLEGSELIEADVNVDLVYSESSRANEFLKTISDYVLPISKLSSSFTAPQTLIGEYANLLSCKSKKKDYRFSSTVRLYEEKDTDRRLHSVSVYAFMAEGEVWNEEDRFSGMSSLTRLRSEININDLRSKVAVKDTALLVVVNYKSKYKPLYFNAERADEKTITKRRMQVYENLQSKLITEEICAKEERLTDFLQSYVELKQAIEKYNGPDIAEQKVMVQIVRYYRRILQVHKVQRNGYRNDEKFVRLYDEIKECTEKEMERASNPNIRKAQELAKRLFDLQEGRVESAEDIKEVLGVLWGFYSYLGKGTKDGVVSEVKVQIMELESKLYKSYYESWLKELSRNNKFDSEKYNELKRDLEESNCETCKRRIEEDERWSAFEGMNRTEEERAIKKQQESQKPKRSWWW